MQLTCPCCTTSFRVPPEALGAGRDVRCARCEEVWFARPPAPDGEIVADGGEAAAAVRDPDTSAATNIEDNDAKDEVPSIVPDGAALIAAADADIVADGDALAGREADAKPPIFLRRVAPRPPRPRDRTFLLAAATGFLALTVFCGVAARASLVRAMPGLAGFYGGAGLDVNLRGLEFRTVRTAQTNQDGIPVLVVEGEIVNVAGQTMEIPKLRLAVLGHEGRELYAWTSQLPRASLKEGEQMPFKSRLASPPPDARQVMVRFVTRADATGSIR
jgi:predicted Zn finger-like uncharacterized protein